ncbi:MAG: sialidase family protein, partial [Planctomycetota bacterium]|nr:sialidase family protein [Planctomycetota bacterium]
LIHSQTSGWTWSAPRRIDPPIAGPSFEICHRIVELTDGRWLAPTSTWKGWDGSAPNGMQAIALVSHDRGVTWPDYIPISNEYQRGIITWEVGLAELAGGQLAATLWRFDERQDVSLSSRFTVAEDGQRFMPPVDNGLQGETAKLTALADGRVLCLYRRLDRPGLWAELARIEGPRWIRECEAVVWQGPKSGLLGRTNSSDELSSLKFGYPSAIQLPDGDILALFWCVEESLHVIRWMRLRID